MRGKDRHLFFRSKGSRADPVLTSASANGRIVGTLDSAPNQSYEIDFYAGEKCDESGFGEGKTYLGSAGVTTDGSGSAVIDVTLNGVTPAAGDSVTATATSAGGSTSEYSACAVVEGGETEEGADGI